MNKMETTFQFDGTTDVDKFVTKVELLASLKGHEEEKRLNLSPSNYVDRHWTFI